MSENANDTLPQIPEDKQGYELALHMAGATIHAMQDFGSYQGDWWALVTYDGRTGWVHGYYGSCSGCDAFEGEFGWTDYKTAAYPSRLAAFGREYLEDIVTTDEALAEAARHSDWDSEAAEVVAFIKEEASKNSQSGKPAE